MLESTGTRKKNQHHQTALCLQNRKGKKKQRKKTQLQRKKKKNCREKKKLQRKKKKTRPGMNAEKHNCRKTA
jgi:hypothetical protein